MILFWTAAALAAEPVTLTLEDALRRSLETSESVALSEAAVDRARGARRQAIANHLPSVGGTLTYDHTFVNEFEQRLEAALEDAAAEGMQRAAGTDATTPPATTTPPGTTTYGYGGGGGGAPAAPDFGELFATDNTWRVALQVSQPIFGGLSAIAQDRLASAQTDAADAGLTSARAAAALEIAQAYFDAALADRLVEIAEATLRQAETTLANARLGNEVGRTAEFDLLRAQVEAENQRVAVIRQQRQRDNARTRLLQLLDLPADTELALATPLDDTAPAAEAAVEVAGAPEEGTAAAVRQSEATVRMSEASLMLARSVYYPVISATMSGGFASYPPTFAPDQWYPSLSAGFSVVVPLFGGGRARGGVITAQAGVAEARALLDQTSELTEAQARDARLALEAAEAQWASTQGTVQQAERAYAIAEVRFREGVSTQSELADARLLLQQALANRAQAARDLQVARIRLALLPALPVQSAFP